MTHSLLCLLSLCGSTFWSVNVPPVFLCWMKEQTCVTSVPAEWLFWQQVSSSLSISPVFISHHLSLPLCVSAPCYCIAFWCEITYHYIVTLAEVCHYGSFVSVGKWTCCGTLDFNFPCLRLNLSNLRLTELLPPSGSVWQPENTISLITGITSSSFAFDYKTINAQMCWRLTRDLSHQLKAASSLLLSGSLDPGVWVRVCAVFLSDSHDPLPLNEGEQGWEMRHFRAQGFISTA